MRLFPCNLDISTYPIVPVFSARRTVVSSVREDMKYTAKRLTPCFIIAYIRSFCIAFLTGPSPLGLCELCLQDMCFVSLKRALCFPFYSRHYSAFVNEFRKVFKSLVISYQNDTSNCKCFTHLYVLQGSGMVCVRE
jgi:hypothetical protein